MLFINFNYNGTLSKENRYLEPFPTIPTSIVDIKTFTNHFEKWLKDRIGFREQIVYFYKSAIYHLFKYIDNDKIALGENETMFFYGINNTMQRYFRILEAFNCNPEYNKSLSEDLHIMETDAKYVKLSKKPILFVAVPTSPVFRFDDMPPFLKKSIPIECVKNIPLEQVVEEFKIKYPKISQNFIYPLTLGRELNKDHPVYPQKNFHWSISPFSEAVAKIVAQKMNLKPIESELSFHDCDTVSDISHIVGMEMINYNDLCYDNRVFTHIKKIRWEDHDFPYNALKKYPITITINTERNKNVLIIGDSFGWTLQDVLSRYFGSSAYLEYYAFMRILNNNDQEMRKGLMLIKDNYEFDCLIIIKHNKFFFITEDSPLTVLF